MKAKLTGTFLGVTFLEKLCDKLEDHFIGMDAKRKLDKRQAELSEIQSAREQFEKKLKETQE